MDLETRRRLFAGLRTQLLFVREWRREPRVFIFESSVDLLVAFALQHATYEEGPDLSAFGPSLDLMVKSGLPREVA